MIFYLELSAPLQDKTEALQTHNAAHAGTFGNPELTRLNKLTVIWDEFDVEQWIWTIPAHRMNAGREHRIPLTARALAILQQLSQTRLSDHVFSGLRPGRPLSGMAMAMLMRRMKEDQYTVHGFRSSFRDWAGEETSFPREIAEAALAHTIGDATERAYRRGDALEKRRKLMQAWDEYLTATPDGKVITFPKRGQ